MLVPNRHANTPDYRYGFNGIEKDDELKGNGNSYDFGARFYDARVGRFLSLDPDKKLYNDLSPYVFAGNNPIALIDEEGKGPIVPKFLWQGQGYDIAFFAGMIDGLWDTGEGLVNQAVDWHPVNWLLRPKEQWERTKGAYEQVSSVVKIVSDEKLRGQVYASIQDAIGTWVDDVTGKNGADNAGYAHGKIAFEVIAAVVAVEEMNLLLKGGKFSKEGLDLIKKNAKRIVQALKPCGCFTAGTQVYTEEGYKNIEDIKIGDKVWASNDKTGELELKKVVDTFTRKFTQVYKISFGNEVVEATHEHPFFIGGRWLKVDELKIGDKLTLYDGSNMTITNIELVEGSFKVYNFTVDEFHTYFVSKLNVLVHNGDPCPWSKLSSNTLSVVKYKFKHYINNTKSNWKDVVASTLNGPAKFKGSTNDVDDLIRHA